MIKTPDLEIVCFGTAQAWEDWLNQNHAQPNGLRLKIAKKGSDQTSVSYLEALDAALCYGWIDGQKQAFDSSFWLQRFTPRRARSTWSQVNCVKAEALIKSDRMQPAGLMAIEAAKAQPDATYVKQTGVVSATVHSIYQPKVSSSDRRRRSA